MNKRKRKKASLTTSKTGSLYHTSPKTKERKTKEILVIKATSPTTVSSEIPILSILRDCPVRGCAPTPWCEK